MTSRRARENDRGIEIIDLASDSEHEDQIPQSSARDTPGSTSPDGNRPSSFPSPIPLAYTDVPLSDIYDFIDNEPNLTEPCKRILRLCVQIPIGRYTTYRAIKDEISYKFHMTSLRAVRLALQKNPCPPEIPCHRVVASNCGNFLTTDWGSSGTEWGDHGLGIEERARLLWDEGVEISDEGNIWGHVFIDWE